ncbi:MAG: hypothetical protein EBR62_01010 [Verrucomicrobia bacterium]|jgi:hypothetical protein|nr:hypothetical protein [Verrucomicrobiota bacterium]
MPLLRLCLFLACCSALPALAADTPKAESRHCALRFAWWNFPRKVPELALQMGRERIPVSPNPMSLSNPIDYKGDVNAVLLKKVTTGETEKDGKPKFGWVPYATIALNPTDTDLGVLLLPNETDDTCFTKTFDFSLETFPYGTLKLVNFSRARIACSLEGSVFLTEPGQVGHCPKKFEERTTAAIAVAALEADGQQKVLYSTKVILNKTFRTLFFIVEKNGTEDERYQTQCILDVNPYPNGVPPPVAPSGNGKGKAEAKPSAKPTK